MPENDAADGSTSRPNGRKRPSQSRVVPAIPLALSKSRQPKSLPKAGRQARAGETPTTSTPPTPAVDVADTHGDDLERGVVSPFRTDSDHVLPPPGLEQTAEKVQIGVSHSPTDTPVFRGSAPTSLSNGATSGPSAPEPQSLATPPPPPTSSQPALLSSSPGRKSNGKSDMRLRTRLPPDFVPSTDRQTPQSATSSPQHLSRRVHHPSTNSIVFGGYDSAASSPAPPQSADSNLNPTQWPPLGASRPPPFTPSGHAYHNSEPVGRRMHDPSSVPWHMRQGFHSPIYPPPQFQHQAHAPFRYPPREVFTPAEESHPNGLYHRSRSQSQTPATAPRNGEELPSPATADGVNSLKYASRDTATAFQPLPPQLRHHYGQFPQASHPTSPAMTSRSDDAEALRYHVYSQFCNPTLADCHLQIVERESGARQYLDAHKIILSRSPTLLDIIQTSESPISAALKTQVPVHLRDHNLRIKPFMDCVRYLYGGSLTTLNQLIQTSVNSEAPTKNEERMELVLQYVAIAAWLRLPAVAARAMDTTLSLLHWDTMAAVLAFALDGGLGPSFTVEDGSEMSCASSDDSLGRADGIGMPTYDPYSTNLLHRVINFTVHMFPPNFYLDATAPQLASPPRLPPLPPAHESRPSRSDPRLSQIRFGELSLEDHKMPSLVTTTISSLLLSLPFPLLKCVLEHNGMVFQLGPDTVASIMRQVVAEREVRRKRVLQARTAGQTEDGAGLLLVQNLYFEERVEASALHRAGFRVARTKRGVDTPPSSGPGSEGSKQG